MDTQTAADSAADPHVAPATSGGRRLNAEATREQVYKICDDLVAKGISTSARNIRHELGAGSPNRLLAFRDEWAKDRNRVPVEAEVLSPSDRLSEETREGEGAMLSTTLLQEVRAMVDQRSQVLEQRHLALETRMETARQEARDDGIRTDEKVALLQREVLAKVELTSDVASKGIQALRMESRNDAEQQKRTIRVVLVLCGVTLVASLCVAATALWIARTALTDAASSRRALIEATASHQEGPGPSAKEGGGVSTVTTTVLPGSSSASTPNHEASGPPAGPKGDSAPTPAPTPAPPPASNPDPTL